METTKTKIGERGKLLRIFKVFYYTLLVLSIVVAFLFASTYYGNGEDWQWSINSAVLFIFSIWLIGQQVFIEILKRTFNYIIFETPPFKLKFNKFAKIITALGFLCLIASAVFYFGIEHYQKNNWEQKRENFFADKYNYALDNYARILSDSRLCYTKKYQDTYLCDMELKNLESYMNSYIDRDMSDLPLEERIDLFKKSMQFVKENGDTPPEYYFASGFIQAIQLGNFKEEMIATKTDLNDLIKQTTSIPSNPQPVKQNTPEKKVSTDTNSFKSIWKDVQLGSATVSQDGLDFSDSFTNFGQIINDYNIPNSTDHFLGSFGIDKETTGNWWEANLTLNNTQTNQISLGLWNIKIVDQAGRTYYPEAGSFCGATTIFSKDFANNIIVQPIKLQPNIPCVSLLLFEVGKDSTGASFDLQYNDGYPYTSL